jgi:hypothetical protein
MGIVSDLTDVADDILGVRDAIGATIHPIYILTRQWSGAEPGDGTAVDTVAIVKPSPAIKSLAHDFVAIQAGSVQSGDLLLKGISKQSYPLKESVAFTAQEPNIEKFYRIDGALYQVISVVENYIYWNVQIRRVTHE